MRNALAAILVLSTSSIAFAGCPTVVTDWGSHNRCTVRPYVAPLVAASDFHTERSVTVIRRVVHHVPHPVVHRPRPALSSLRAAPPLHVVRPLHVVAPLGLSVRGYDSGHHSYWATDIDPRGNMYGYDARGNYWRYDASVGATTYFNSTPSWNLFSAHAGWEP